MNNAYLDNKTDKELVTMSLQGNQLAFRQIILQTEKLVAHVVFSMIDRKEDREDLAQDIYLKVYKNLGSFRYKAKLSTWIAQIAYNTCISHLRKKRPKLLDPADSYWAQKTDEIDQPLQAMFQKQLSVALQNGIKNLSPVYKTLITLYHNESLSYEEISEITNIPEGTIKSYLFRARKALHDHIAKTYKNEAL